MSAAEQIRSARAAAGITQGELAARTGVRQPNIAAYEKGTRSPSSLMLQRLLDALRIRPSVSLERHRAEVLDAAASLHATNVRVFGSVARGEDTPDSDVDLLVTFEATASLYDQAELIEVLSDILGHPVDVVSDRNLGRLGRRIIKDAAPL